MPISAGRKRIVILGAGFGGLYTTLGLQKLLKPRDAEIVLISRQNYYLMTPLLFEAGTGILEPRHAVTPIRPLLTHARFIEGNVTNIDFNDRIVFAEDIPWQPFAIKYDHLVIALGGVTNTSRIAGAEHALQFKILGDAIFLRNYVIDIFEQADVELDPIRRQELLTFVIVGAGLVGVELMGELTIFTKRLCRFYPRINPSDLRYYMIDAGPHFLPELEGELADYAAATFKTRGVEILSSTPVQSIETRLIHLPGDRHIASATIVIATGVAPNPLIRDFPLAKDDRGKIITEPTLRARGYENVWALGDCAHIPDPNGKPYPPLAQHALREARILAANLAATVHNKPRQIKPFVYKTLGTLAALGHYKGIGRIWKFQFRGFLAWWIWRTYYLFQLPRWNRRFRVMLDWTIALFFKNDIVKLDLFGLEHPIQRISRQIPPGPAPKPELID